MTPTTAEGRLRVEPDGRLDFARREFAAARQALDAARAELLRVHAEAGRHPTHRR